MSPIVRSAFIALGLIVATAPLHAQELSGGPISRLVSRLRQRRPDPATNYSYQPTAVSPPAPGPQVDCSCSTDTGADPYGFAAILNRLRASAGLHPVIYDTNLSAWASQNNAVQCRRGLGHHVNPCCAQNCGWNYTDACSVAQGWMNSPGHRENMLSPTITRFGIALGPGPYWTLNAR
jgi:uncharacterized protein YkwD